MQKTVIEQILEGIKAGHALYNKTTEDLHGDGGALTKAAAQEQTSELCRGDNLAYMRHLLESGLAGKFKLIYIDPPFFTRSSFNASVVLRDTEGKKHQIHHLAYDDKFDRNLEYYIENMTARLLLMKDLLADDGLMWVHLDWHSSHYIKLVMDELMGEKNFINEIIWCYKSGGSGKRHFARKHDSILVYSKSKNYKLEVPLEKSYNRDYKPYRFKGVEEFRDEVGWYTMVNMKDVWNIDMVGRTSAERTGYATQKPLELMHRIVECCTSEGDLVGDFFCGSGSLLEAAESMGRTWAGCDSEQLALAMSRKRLEKAGASFSYIQMDDAKPLHGRASIKIVSKQALEDGRFLYKCTLTDIVPDIDTGSIQLSDRKHVERALKENRIQFADYIILDNGNSDIILGETGSEMSFMAGDSFEITAIDVFGKEYLADIDFAI